MIIIYLSFFNNSQDADSLCCYTLAQLHCLHVVFVLCAGEVKQINRCLHVIARRNDTFENVIMQHKLCNVFPGVWIWRTWHSHDATCTHLTYRILSIKCCRIYLCVLFFSLMYMYILIDNFFGLVESATLYCD